MDPSKFLGASPLQTSLATLATLLLLAPRLVSGFNCVESPLPDTVGDPSGWGWAPPLRESGMKTSNRELGPAIIIVLLPTVLPHGTSLLLAGYICPVEAIRELLLPPLPPQVPLALLDLLGLRMWSMG